MFKLISGAFIDKQQITKSGGIIKGRQDTDINGLIHAFSTLQGGSVTVQGILTQHTDCQCIRSHLAGPLDETA